MCDGLHERVRGVFEVGLALRRGMDEEREDVGVVGGDVGRRF